MKKYILSSNGIGNYLADLYMAAWKISGNENIARSNTQSIIRYVTTGRASTDFVKAMLQHRPSTIAKRCLIGGSDQEIIDRIKKLVGETI